ncbi:GDP-mannose mannosyl hydrolase [Thiosulfativibrio zosterae]|uniref:GDP-mannose mannosyl hydrolase n=1 Tax=Thiosulfativibrio zosterae TaxID=2675053 RepID=A0A6F8PR42_9GAMM|nr:GDP-mannose mannosyl hydrolase [Thiosulfativibrio zosterae]BBP44497.1 GDP-mannose mannosyl hydrolase [Thiosulfativibrio zosterae]
MTTESNLLPLKAFKQVVQNAPLFAIDLVVVNDKNQILVGERLNAPAKGALFVPGGRVYKNESLEDAFKRLSKAELGCELERHQACLLGLYDHFYDDSFFSANISTHYINATHAIRLSTELLNLPTEQHNKYLWVAIDELANDETVHKFSKVFLPALINWL